ncbi:MAG: extracellular solute-binding protein [Oscillospiraceae bacterium]|nr:extracellular solute-binding protein [Oscillospiraceae bacterium]
MKRILSMILAAACCLGIAGMTSGCSEKSAAQAEEVTLSVWCAHDDIALTEQLIEGFKKEYSGKAVFNITISEEEELSCKETVLANPSGAADVYAFAADQYKALHDANALLEITLNTEEIIKANGGRDSGAIRCSSSDGKLFAYPKTASNGYFLYYNSDYFTEDDIKSLDRILEVAEKAGKKVTIDYTSGWYIYSFFKGAGLNVDLNTDGLTNTCGWNSADGQYTGRDVAEAMLRIAQHPAFVSGGDDDFKKFIKSGEAIAGINGAWNSTLVQEAFGDGYAAAKLPEYTIKDGSVQMCSFAGYKMIGVNSATKYPEWSMRLAEWLTNEKSQTERFKQRGEAPSNVNAANSPDVSASPAIRALNEQSSYGYLQNVGEAFWQPAYVFGTTIAAGNPDGTELQMLLDIMVRGIESMPEG